jgi:flagellar biosynthesis/type III secretory pathway protein FliH
MPADTTTFYVLLFVICAITLITIALTVAYWLLFSKYTTLRDEIFKRQKDEALAFQKRLSESKKQSIEIFENALSKSHEIVSKAEEINKNNQTSFSHLVNETLNAQKDSYDNALAKISENTQKTIQSLPENITKEVLDESQNFFQELQSLLKKSLQEPYEKALMEAERYKTQRIKAFEENLFENLRII